MLLSGHADQVRHYRACLRRHGAASACLLHIGCGCMCCGCMCICCASSCLPACSQVPAWCGARNWLSTHPPAHPPPSGHHLPLRRCSRCGSTLRETASPADRTTSPSSCGAPTAIARTTRCSRVGASPACSPTLLLLCWGWVMTCGGWGVCWVVGSRGSGKWRQWQESRGWEHQVCTHCTCAHHPAADPPTYRPPRLQATRTRCWSCTGRPTASSWYPAAPTRRCGCGTQ